jgi:hypothetical protein
MKRDNLKVMHVSVIISTLCYCRRTYCRHVQTKMIISTLRLFNDQMLLLNRFGAENKQGNNKDFICEKEKHSIASRSTN